MAAAIQGKHVFDRLQSKMLSGLSVKAEALILAKCYECMGNYDGGIEDCKIPLCPLYSRMPYRGKSYSSCPMDAHKIGRQP